MKVAVTGSEGFIGSNLVKLLESMNYQVVPIDKTINRLGYSHQCDILDTDSLYGLIRSCDAVVHLAAKPGVGYSIANPNETHTINVMGTRSVLRACEAAGIKRLLYASSSSVYGNQTGLLHEGLPTQPTSPYAVTKVANEVDASQSSVPSLGMRFFTVYGNNGRPDMAYSIFANSMWGRRPLTVTGISTSRDFTHVSTVTSSIEQLLHVSTTGVVNICQGGNATLGELISHLERGLGIPATVIEKPLPCWSVPHTFGDNTKLQGIINVMSKPLREGLEEYTKWFIVTHSSSTVKPIIG